MNFGEALELLKQGKKVKRSTWGGYWFYVKRPLVTTGVDEEGYVQGFTATPTIFACLKNGGGTTVATPYQADILAEDWEEV